MFMHGSDTSMALAERITKLSFYRDFRYVKQSNMYQATTEMTALADNAEQHRSENYGDLWCVFYREFIFALNEKTKNLYNQTRPIMEGMSSYKDFSENYSVQIPFSEILKQTKINRKAYVDLVGLAKTFDTYPAIAWPVTYDTGKSNIALFKTVKSKSRHPPGPTSSLLGAKVSDAIVRLSESVEVIAAQKLIPATTPAVLADATGA